MAQNEDIEYNVSDHAVADEPKQDPDQSNKTVILDIQKYLAEAIVEHSTIGVIDLTEQAKMDPRQQIAVHKVVVQHLQNIKSTIDNKVKELL